MRRWNRWGSDEEGSAALEFIVTGLLLLVPMVYLVVALGGIQEQTLGAEAAARHTARVIGQAPDAATAVARAETVLAGVIEGYGMDADRTTMSMRCEPRVSPCPSAGATVIVSISTRTSLPLVPDVLGLAEAAGIPIEASAAQKVSRLWAR